MVDHFCLHEVDWGRLDSHMETSATNQKRIIDAIEGNGKEGLKTTVAVNKKAITRIWWILGIITMVNSAIAIFILKTIISTTSGGAL